MAGAFLCSWHHTASFGPYLKGPTHHETATVRYWPTPGSGLDRAAVRAGTHRYDPRTHYRSVVAATAPGGNREGRDPDCRDPGGRRLPPRRHPRGNGHPAGVDDRLHADCPG